MEKSEEFKKINELSIFFPFWNEGKNVEKVALSAIPVAEKVAKKWEMLLIDDGSSDNTLTIAEKVAQKNKNVRVISHTPNRGYGSALREGFENAKYDTVVFTDGDGQFDFSEVTKFIDAIPGSDMVIGYRKKRRDNALRHLLMYMLKLWDFIFFGFHFKDIDCGFKMFKKSALNQIMPLRSDGAMITTEILAKAKNKKLNIKQVEVAHYPREFGAQSGANFGVVFRAILESFILWSDIRSSRF